MGRVVTAEVIDLQSQSASSRGSVSGGLNESVYKQAQPCQKAASLCVYTWLELYMHCTHLHNFLRLFQCLVDKQLCAAAPGIANRNVYLTI